MADHGITNSTSNDYRNVNNNMRGRRITVNETGYITDVFARILETGPGNTYDWKAEVYDNAGNPIHLLSSNVITNVGAASYVQFPLPSNIQINSGDVINVGIWAEGSTGQTAGLCYDSPGSGIDAGGLHQTWPTPPDPWTVQQTDSRDYAVYVSVTPSGGIIKSVTDSGVGSDTASLSVGVGVTDSGVGVDDPPAVSVYQHVLDAATAIDNIPGITSLITVSDSGVGTDALTSSAHVLAGESGSGSDFASMLVAISVVDTGTGVDLATLLPEIIKSVADSGSGSDQASVSVNVSAIDSGTVNELSTVNVFLNATDVGSGLDSATVFTQTIKTVLDAGTGVDSVGMTAGLLTSDSGTGADALTLSVNLSVTDVGVGVDLTSKLEQFIKTVTDAGVGSDNVGVSVTVSAQDSGLGVDQTDHLAILTALETVGASDVVVRYIDGATVIASISFTLNSRSISGTVKSRTTDIKLN